MSDTQGLLCAIAIAALCVAVLAGWREHRRRRRADPDAVGWVDWTLVQVIALIVAAIASWIALKA
jgi:multisubunit Na+/H+ antiporter MnhB subunit